MDAFKKYELIEKISKALAKTYEENVTDEVLEKHERYDIVKTVLIEMMCRIAKDETDKIDESIMPSRAKSYKILLHSIARDLQEYIGILEPEYNFSRMRYERTKEAAKYLKETVKKKGR